MTTPTKASRDGFDTSKRWMPGLSTMTMAIRWRTPLGLSTMANLSGGYSATLNEARRRRWTDDENVPMRSETEIQNL